MKATLGILVGCYFKIKPKMVGVYLSGKVPALDLCKALYSAGEEGWGCGSVGSVSLAGMEPGFGPQHHINQTRWHTAVIPVLRR